MLSEQGKLLHRIALPERGHDVTFDPVSRRSVVFARQPGTFAVVFDHTGATEPVTISSVEGRHFYGHGVFSPDGRLLYATENDFDNAAGMVGVYDATDGFARVGEFPTHGVGPHEILLLDDGRTLAIANGGIETHPDFGRAKLNIPTMKPSLVFIDRLSGGLIETHELPAELHQLSIRHMDVAGDGGVWFGCQHEGPGDRAAGAGRARAAGRDAATGRHAGRRPVRASATMSARSRPTARPAPSRSRRRRATRSPSSTPATGKVVASQSLVEVCGLAPDHAGFLASTGAGLLVDAAGEQVSEPDFVWDNHLLRIDL